MLLCCMSVNTQGFEYEQKVIDAIAVAGISGELTKAAGASSAQGDADFRLNGQTYLVEVKLDKNAQMGGSSVRYQKGSKEFELLTPVEPEIHSMIIEAVKTRTTELDILIEYFAAKWDTEITGFPASCSKQVWTQAAANGLLVNAKIHTDVSFIARHYKTKGVDYIQIGKSGLFYLEDNPANLPVPKLEGDVRVEIRTARAGSKMAKKTGVRMVGSGIRVQGRLRTKNKSPYTLDCPKSIREMLAKK